MGNHCVEKTCHECGYYECMRCSDSGVSYTPSGPLHTQYLKDKSGGELSKYKKCPNCGAVAMY